jgi:plastocyanin
LYPCSPGAAIRSGAAAIVAIAQARAETVRIDVKSLAFNPAQVTAHVGDTVEWVNGDFLAHTATAKNHDWDVQIPPNKTARLTLKKPGAVDYFCRFHPNMTGTITVEEAKR